MTFTELGKQIQALGREVNLDTIVETRKLIIPLLHNKRDAEVSIISDVEYGHDARHRLDIFTHATSPDQDRPVLIFMHGGGFIGGDKATEGSPFYQNIGKWAVHNGMNAVNITYRLAPAHQYPSGIEDIHQAVSFLQEKGADLGLNPDKLFLMGQSAGAAHAASYVAHPEVYAPVGHGLKGLILISGLYDYTTMATSPLEQAYLGDDESLYQARSSLRGLVESDLPMLVTLSEFDPPFFEQQALQLLSAIQHKRQAMPPFVQLAGQNHMSSVLYLGLEGDVLAPQLLRFVNDLA